MNPAATVGPLADPETMTPHRRRIEAIKLLEASAQRDTDPGSRGYTLGMVDRVRTEGCTPSYLEQLRDASYKAEVLDNHAHQVGRAHSDLMHATHELRRLRDRAGRAAEDSAAVDRDLTTAAEVFATEDWANLTLEEVAQAAGKIERLARQLLAAEKIPHAYDRQQRAGERFREIRAQAG